MTGQTAAAHTDPSPSNPQRTVTKLAHLIMADGQPQYIIAANLHVSPARLSQYSLGRRPIPVGRIFEFCNYFKVAPQDLVGWAE